MDHLHRLAPVLVLTLCLDDQREVRKDRQLSSACSALAGGNILLFWTHLDRLPSADSRYQLQTDLCLLITSSFYPIFILFSGSQSHRASPENRGGPIIFMRAGAPVAYGTLVANCQTESDYLFLFWYDIHAR